MSNEISYAGVYGEYNVAVLKNGESEPHYPFGTGYNKNLITDQFFGTILSGWKHSPQSFMQVCRTSTGDAPAVRANNFSTMTHNDETWASATIFERTVQTGINYIDNKIRMRRDFIFDTLTGTRTYRQAMVGILQSSFPGCIQSNLAVSNFVFPNNITLQSGDRLMINYTLNIVLDYLHPSGTPVILSGDGYDFTGKIKIMASNVGIFNRIDANTTYLGQDCNVFSPGEAGGNLSKSIFVNNPQNWTSTSYDTEAPTRTSQIFGTRSYGNIGFYGTANTLSTYPNEFTNPNSVNAVLGSPASISWSNFQIDENGAYIDGNYYFLPSTTTRNASGIYLACSTSTFFAQRSAVYLQFDNMQTIPAEVPISMRLRWYAKRI